MAEGAPGEVEPAPPAPRAPGAGKAGKGKRRFSARQLIRVVHADLGNFAVGLTFIYALSGLAVNHIEDWDPSFQSYERTHELGGSIVGDDQAVAAVVMKRLEISGEPQEVYRASEEQLDVVFDKRTLHVNPATGRVLDEGQEPRLLLRVANWLHLNRGKKAWTYVADTYAAGLLVLALTGVFMLPGRRGLLGRGGVWLAIGVLVPVLYVHFSGGP